MKIFTILLLILITTACATNEFDARMAEAEASIERTKEESYAKGIEAANQPKVLVRIDGEIRCSQEMIAAQKCGTTFYNPDIQSVAPQRDKNWVDGVTAIGNTFVRGVEALTPIALAREVTSIVDTVGKNAGGNISNVDSGNTHTEQNSTTTKTAQGDLLDAASSKDLSDNSVVTNTETVGNDKIIGNSDRTDNSINDSQNPINTDSNDDSSVVTEIKESIPEPEEDTQ